MTITKEITVTASAQSSIDCSGYLVENVDDPLPISYSEFGSG